MFDVSNLDGAAPNRKSCRVCCVRVNVPNAHSSLLPCTLNFVFGTISFFLAKENLNAVLCVCIYLHAHLPFSQAPSFFSDLGFRECPWKAR